VGSTSGWGRVGDDDDDAHVSSTVSATSRRARALQGAAGGAARAQDLWGGSAAVGPEVDPGLVEGIAHVGSDGAVETVLLNSDFVCG
jgi:hypothetical protein